MVSLTEKALTSTFTQVSQQQSRRSEEVGGEVREEDWFAWDRLGLSSQNVGSNVGPSLRLCGTGLVNGPLHATVSSHDKQRQ